jgi:hypothetical protein
MTVDVDDPAVLARAIQSALGDATLRAELRERAWARAQADFDLVEAQRRFAQVIG